MGKMKGVIFEDTAGELSLNKTNIEVSFNSFKDPERTFGGTFEITPKVLKLFIGRAKEYFKSMPEFPNEHFGFDLNTESDISISISETELKITQKWANGRLSNITCDIRKVEKALGLLLEK